MKEPIAIAKLNADKFRSVARKHDIEYVIFLFSWNLVALILSFIGVYLTFDVKLSTDRTLGQTFMRDYPNIVNFEYL